MAKQQSERPAKRPSKPPSVAEVAEAVGLLGPALRLSAAGQLRVAENMAELRELLAARRLTKFIKRELKGHPYENIDDCEF